jgi:hypothetical protein
MYLKTSVVGLNNNELQLNTRQAILAQCYHSIVTNQLQSSDQQTQLSLDTGNFMSHCKLNIWVVGVYTMQFTPLPPTRQYTCRTDPINFAQVSKNKLFDCQRSDSNFS